LSDDVAGDQLFPHQVEERLTEFPCADHPVRKRGARKIDAEPLQHLLLSIQGQPIAVLRDRDVGQEPWSGQALGNRLRGQRRDLHAALAVGTRVLGTHMAQHLDHRGNDLELLRGLSPDLLQAVTVFGTDLLFFREIVEDLYARDFGRDRSSPALAARVGGDRDRLVGFDLFRVEGIRRALRLVEEAELARVALLAAAAEALVLEQANVLFEKRDAVGLFRELFGLFGELFGLFGELFELLRVLVELVKRQRSQ